jgi:hypothetical protein
LEVSLLIYDKDDQDKLVAEIKGKRRNPNWE